MFVRAYLRASTSQQNATRARQQLEGFATEHSLAIAKFYTENESGASLKRPKLFELIDDAQENDILLIEQVDRLSRLDEADWGALKATLKKKQIKVVALDLPTSWMMTTTDQTTARMFAAVNDMMLDMLAAIARKDYEDRRRRAAQGIEKAKGKGVYKGRKEDTVRNALIQRHLKAGQSSWKEIMGLVGCSRGTVAKQAELLKAAQAD
ncbi:recombinase family protein [Massilia phyllosphaerae]|uniref:recombinase family protein n=1 Tax=Massilia phyllosphaerae TaxID=3106034 RepID=UPI002B1CD6F0|nr:recombinase family protein [Massilia sp. SGZ-792]